MKKTLTALLAIATALTLTACSGQAASETYPTDAASVGYETTGADETQTEYTAFPTDDPLVFSGIIKAENPYYDCVSVDAELLRHGANYGVLGEYDTVEIWNVLPSDFDAIENLGLEGTTYIRLIMDSEYLAELYGSDEKVAMLRGEERERFKDMSETLVDRYGTFSYIDLWYANARDKALMRSEYVTDCARADLPLAGDIAESCLYFDSRLLSSDECPDYLDYQWLFVDVTDLNDLEKLIDISYDGTIFVQLEFSEHEESYSDEERQLIDSVCESLVENFPNFAESRIIRI